MKVQIRARLEIEPVEGEPDSQKVRLTLFAEDEKKASREFPFPGRLVEQNQQWRKDYSDHYRNRPVQRRTEHPQLGATRVEAESSGSISIFRQDQLLSTEKELCRQMDEWSAPKEFVCVQMTKAIASNQQKREKSGLKPASHYDIYLLIQCSDPELERLPWEQWEIDIQHRVSIARISDQTNTVAFRQRRRKPRALVILGHGISPEREKQILESCSRWMEIVFCKPQSQRETIEAIRDQKNGVEGQGWDMLLFLGHSSEERVKGQETTNGHLSITPNLSLSIEEDLAEAFSHARGNGLQFALFNSCEGIGIARALVNLGLSQAVIMREVVHHEVAEIFLEHFFSALNRRQNVLEALSTTRSSLKRNFAKDYPSAYLVPSLFCQPNAELFQLRRPLPLLDCWQWIVLGVLAALSLCPPCQNFLLDRRLYAQSIYREQTHQYVLNPSPQVLLVQMDDCLVPPSQRQQIDRGLLARLVDRLTALNAGVIGIHFLLDEAADRHQAEQWKKQEQLKQSLEKGVARQTPVWFVSQANRNPDDPRRWLEASFQIVSRNWSLSADAQRRETVPYFYPVPQDTASPKLPFAFLLASALHLRNQLLVPQPTLASQSEFQSQLRQHIQLPKRAQLSPLTIYFSRHFRQSWFHPILDITVSPDQAYTRIAGRQILPLSPEHLTDCQSADTGSFPQPDDLSRILKNLNQKVVIISAGYVEAGAHQPGDTNIQPVPEAIAYWRSRQSPPDMRPMLTGGELQAYMTYMHLQGRYIIPIPDLLLLLGATLLGLGVVRFLQRSSEDLRAEVFFILIIIIVPVSSVVSLQLYITKAILLPWFLPSAAFCTCVLPKLLKRR